MTKDDFLNRFSAMNTDIESALATQNFDRAMRIDAVRRQMLHEFTNNLVPDGDKVFFETLERCAADNARAISKINSEIGKVRHSASRNMRRLSGYRGN
jgi:hypothetical protein